MRDEIDGRMWVAHHEAFGASVDRLIGKLRSGLARVAYWDGTTHQLLAMVAAFLITAITFNSTTTA